jgi:hypothetical protein
MNYKALFQKVVYPGTSTVTDSGTVSVFDASGVEISSGNRVLKRDVTIPIRMSKVAPSSGVWNYVVYVFDRLQQEITTPKTGIVEPHYLRANNDYVNQWYGEIAVEAGSEVIFPTVAAGSGFSTSSGVISVNFISNGRYSKLVSADTTWKPNAIVPTRPIFAYLVPSSGLTNPTTEDQTVLNVQGNRFALQARRVEFNGASGITEYVGIVLNSGTTLVPANSDSNYAQDRNTGTTMKSSKIVEITTADATNELGVVSKFDFQIRLSQVFQTVHGDTNETTRYDGNIQLGISNDGGGNFFNFIPGS